MAIERNENKRQAGFTVSVPARFRWGKESGRFVAYPVGTERPGRFVSVHLGNTGLNTSVEPHQVVETWHWTVRWEGWFSRSGVASSKQAAADKATEEWWKAVDTEIPRDVDLEAAMIAARVLVRPPPNSLLAEEMAFLQKVQWHLHNIYRTEVKRDEAPAPVKELMGRISEELYRRRVAG